LPLVSNNLLDNTLLKNMEEKVILVDSQDRPLGLMEKMEAHERALLHRAFSVFIFNNRGEMMLQQRAHSKYHSGGLWTNTCCSHPRDGETVEEAGSRRLMEEMGFQTDLMYGFHFIYKAVLEHGLTEHELDHVLLGFYEDEPQINPEEVADWKWMSFEALIQDIASFPDKYTAWFKIIMADHGEQIFAVSQKYSKVTS
jgi:isopentenyl-diphosphate delta-isomerase